MKTVPSTSQIQKLSLEHSLYSSVLSRFTGIDCEVRNHAGLLRSHLPRLEPISLEGESWAIDPDQDLGFCTDVLHSTFVIARDGGDRTTLEFDFEEFPQGLILSESIPSPKSGLGDLMSDLFADRSLTEEELSAHRADCSVDRPMCPCCVKKATQRAEHASLHPLFDILMRAVHGNFRYRFRLLSSHADHSAEFVPWSVYLSDGSLFASDRSGEHLLVVDMRTVHAMGIQTCRIDGEFYSTLQIFDSHGIENFRITSSDPNEALIWRNTCEWSKQFFTQ